MKKFLTRSLLFVGFMSLPVVISPQQASATPTPDYRNDPRLKSIRDFFRHGACPAERFAEVFLHAADLNNLDWRLLPSLSFVETTGGKTARNNNMFGWDAGRER